jgi:group II intron reverse transcriptase/maturase
MLKANEYLNIVKDRGSKRLPLADVYRNLFNQDLYLTAYGKIARNSGAMTPGTTPETADGMNLDKIQAIIDLLRQERYRWTPVRRVYIEKKNSTKKRPLGVPTWSDKLLQEVVRLILEAYYEPQFSPASHGFRPERGCHTALRDIYHTWIGTAWFMEGDITGCFDNIDHSVLLSILGESIHDNRFLRLVEGLLKAGYLEEWRYGETLSGTPQGGIVSPVLANIYLDRLDRFVMETLIPQFTLGERRKASVGYTALGHALGDARRKGDRGAIRRIEQVRREVPSVEPNDAHYRRLRYIRYADDFLLGFAGPKAEAEAITDSLRQFLRNSLRLELSEAKTKITHARTEAASFLGYSLRTAQSAHKLTRGKRSVNGNIGLFVPPGVVQDRARRYMRNGKPVHRQELSNDAVLSIVRQYEWEYRGVVQYYRLAQNLHVFARLKWVMETSLTKTLASKLRVSVSEVYRRYRPVPRETGITPSLQVELARDGKEPLSASWSLTTLRRDLRASIHDKKDGRPAASQRTELVKRLLADTCELCGAQGDVEVHHIRALKDLKVEGRAELPAWKQMMSARRRKTLVACQPCHEAITHGRYHGPKIRGSLESRVP